MPSNTINGITNVLTQLGNNQTNIDAICYPSDILSDTSEYANSYTAFYISVHKDEALSKVDVLEDNNRYTNAKQGAMQTANQRYGKDTYTKAGKGGVVVAQVATIDVGGKFIGGSEGLKNKISDFSKVAITANTLVGALGENNLAYRQQRAFIVLPTPALTSSYNFSWDEEPMTLSAGAAEFISNTMKAGASTENMMQAFMSKFGAFVGNSSDALSALQSKSPEFGPYMSKMSGRALNPRKEQIFKDVGFREFTFSYTFAPRNEKESLAVNKIIQQFKYHAHPSLQNNNFLYTYPSEFDIVHYYNNRINPYLPRHATSVLKNVSVNYAPNGHYNVNRDGFPSQIQLSLTFGEVAILTKSDFELNTVANGTQAIY